ncbi:hypothetical protein N0V95_005335 [Ascochyta clinopodiicola]|nr:hypothetical protein N0V95_005335 [Ascochyta clinopodiicola]
MNGIRQPVERSRAHISKKETRKRLRSEDHYAPVTRAKLRAVERRPAEQGPTQTLGNTSNDNWGKGRLSQAPGEENEAPRSTRILRSMANHGLGASLLHEHEAISTDDDNEPDYTTTDQASTASSNKMFNDTGEELGDAERQVPTIRFDYVQNKKHPNKMMWVRISEESANNAAGRQSSVTRTDQVDALEVPTRIFRDKMVEVWEEMLWDDRYTFYENDVLLFLLQKRDE